MSTVRVAALVSLLAVAAASFGGEDYAKEKFKGGIKGVILWEGDPPKRPMIDTSGDKACHAMHAETPLRKEETAIVKDGKLANVLVYLKKGTEKYNYEAPTTPVKLDQKGCQYVPHVLGVMAGQPIEINNSDALTHNVHGLSPKRINPEFNISQATAGAKDKKKLSEPELPYTIQCDVHRWMNAKVGVFDHPFFAVSAEDGSFDIANVPPGEYEIEAWHETLPAQTAKVTVAADGAVEQKFTFKK